MGIRLEQIDELRQRANVSYEEAKEALEKNNGSMVEALIYLEKENKTKSKLSEKPFCEKIKKGFKKLSEYKFITKKNEAKVIDLPLSIFLIFIFLGSPLSWILLIAGFFKEYKYSIKRDGQNCYEINDMINNITKKDGVNIKK